MSYKRSFLTGGLYALFFVTQNTFAYDQINTHPALTSEAVNFYNLSFPQNKVSEEEKQLMIKGVIEEDQPPRWTNHSYDPVHNKAWLNFRTSKVWGMSSNSQQQIKYLYAISPLFESKVNNENDFYDFSYERTLLDYAKGNRKRAFEAMGHVLHLLEDANVPEHTRLDIHLPVHGMESPYETLMSKWNPQNFNVAKKLYNRGEKPVLLNSLDNYFDEIAGYSNGYFFSQDTITNDEYLLPKISKVNNIKIGNKELSFGVGVDKDGKEFELALLDVRLVRNIFEIKHATLVDKSIGTRILDDYWSRLSKDFVLHGAGVIKLFLDQAEQAKKEYERQLALKAISEKENKNPNFLQKIGSIFTNIISLGKNQSQPINGLTLVQKVIKNTQAADEENIGIETTTTTLATKNTNEGTADNVGIGTGTRDERQGTSDANIGKNIGTGTTTLLPKELNSPKPTPLEKTNFFYGWGSSGGSQTTTTTTPSPSVSGSPAPSPSTTTTTTTSTTTTTLAPSTTPSPSTTPTPEQTLGKIIINEIAWMGTATSSSDEWLELYNTSSKSVDISGWTLKALDGTPKVSIASKSIDPFSFYLLERTNDKTISDIFADQIYTGALDNSGEVLELRDKSSKLQDIVSKSSDGSWYAGSNGSTGSPPQAKSSMERKDPLKSGKDSSNWGTNNGITKNGKDAAGGQINGTPKAKNSIFSGQKPNKINNLAIASASGNKINFSWSAPSDSDTLPTGLQYDFRYATKSFDLSTDWDSAQKAASLPAVDNFGKIATSSLTIENFNKQYFFTIKTKDTDNNTSDISNQVNFTLPSAVSSLSWSMSGFNQTHTLKAGFSGPFASTAKTSWGIQLLSSPPVSFGQPVVAPNGNVYFGTSNGTTVTQLRATTPSGAESWHYDATSGATIGTPVALSDNSLAFGYITIGSEFTKLSATGSAKFASAIGTISSVTVDKDGTTYFTTSADNLFAIAPSGAQKWQVTKSGIGGFTPMVYEDKIYITARISGVPTFYAFDAKNGDFLWSKTMSTNSPSCCGVSDISYDSGNDFLYAGANQYILKIDRNGNTLDQFLADRQNGWGYTTTMISQDSANLVFGVDFSISNPASKSAIYAVNKSTKNTAWTYQLDSKVNKQISLDSGGNSYFSTKNGKVYSLSSSGILNWTIDLGDITSNFPVIGPGVLYITLDNARLVKIVP